MKAKNESEEMKIKKTKIKKMKINMKINMKKIRAETSTPHRNETEAQVFMIWEFS